MSSALTYTHQLFTIRLIAAILCLGTVAAAGCRTTRDNQIDILESELRAQEDYIYELENYVVEYSEKLRDYRCAQSSELTTESLPGEPELAEPLPKATSKQAAKLKPKTTTSAPPIQPESTTPEQEMVPEMLETPELELEIGEPLSYEEPPHASPIPKNEQNTDSVIETEGYHAVAEEPSIPDPSDYELEESTEQVAEQPLEDAGEQYDALFDEEAESAERSREAENLVITQVFRNGAEDNLPTSLLAVVEARDSINEPADLDGAVSLMVMTSDPEAPQRIKRWDFTPEETAAAWQSSTLGDGLHLELPLEQIELPAGGCELWVRLVTNDGRKLLTQIPIEPQTLATLEQTEEQLAAAADERAQQLADVNPLRSTGRTLETATPLPKPAAATRPETQWRAATHYATGVNSGFGTTAKNQGWTTTTPSRREPIPPKSVTTTSGPKWTARK